MYVSFLERDPSDLKEGIHYAESSTVSVTFRDLDTTKQLARQMLRVNKLIGLVVVKSQIR